MVLVWQSLPWRRLKADAFCFALNHTMLHSLRLEDTYLYFFMLDRNIHWFYHNLGSGAIIVVTLQMCSHKRLLDWPVLHFKYEDLIQKCDSISRIFSVYMTLYHCATINDLIRSQLYEFTKTSSAMISATKCHNQRWAIQGFPRTVLTCFPKGAPCLTAAAARELGAGYRPWVVKSKQGWPGFCWSSPTRDEQDVKQGSQAIDGQVQRVSKLSMVKSKTW